jgi:dCTP deaminase
VRPTRADRFFAGNSQVLRREKKEAFGFKLRFDHGLRLLVSVSSNFIPYFVVKGIESTTSSGMLHTLVTLRLATFLPAVGVFSHPFDVALMKCAGSPSCMGVLSDFQIRELIKIEPFADGSKRPGRVSFGVSSYGYDIRVGSRFKIFTPTPRSGQVTVVDPKSFDDDLFVEVDCAKLGLDHVIIPPNSFALCETVETIEVPRDVLVLCVGKSTYARCGLIVNVTPLEPEWRGKITLEISNTTPLPAKVYADEGIAQLVFLKADQVCEVSYADKKGKYQDQSGLTLPKVD